LSSDQSLVFFWVNGSPAFFLALLELIDPECPRVSGDLSFCIPALSLSDRWGLRKRELTLVNEI
jgi:hypothetical protein